MARMAKRLKGAALNLVAPGIGQFALKRWLRGLLFLGASLACFVWTLVGFFKIMVGNLYNAVEGRPVEVNLHGVFGPMGLIILVWIISYVDLFLFKVPEPPPPSENSPAESAGKPREKDGISDEEKIRREVARQIEELRNEGKIVFKDDDGEKT